MLRRLALSLTLLLATGALAACSTGSTVASADPSATTTADADAFPVTLESVFGETTIDRAPVRVATLGSSDADNVLALGIVPVGVPAQSWGANANKSDDWFDAELERLGGTMPTQYSDTDGIPFDDIAATQPDLILATTYGMTKADYQKLSKIAPTLAYPGAAWTTTWQKSLELDAAALGRSELGKQLEQRTEQAITDARADYPQLQGKTFIYAAMSATDLSSIPYYTTEDGRERLLTEFGMVSAPIVEKLEKKGQFYGTVSAERAADLESDIFITYGTKPSDAATYAHDPLVGQVPAIKAGHLVTLTDNRIVLAGTIPSPLSIPYAIKHYLPLIAAGA